MKLFFPLFACLLCLCHNIGIQKSDCTSILLEIKKVSFIKTKKVYINHIPATSEPNKGKKTIQDDNEAILSSSTFLSGRAPPFLYHTFRRITLVSVRGHKVVPRRVQP